MTKVKTAIFPVGGMGTRFLPITKSLPKEMLPILDKPLIQYVVEEAVTAGIKNLVFVTNYTKRALEDYFDSNFELETRLAQKGKHELLSRITHLLPSDVNIVYVRQKSPLGLGDAILCAKNVVGNQPFVVSLADDVLSSGSQTLGAMLACFNNTGSNVIAVEEVAPEKTNQYGIVDLHSGSNLVKTLVEKPSPEQAPSNLGVIGRYVLMPEIFDCLEQTKPGAGGEIQLTDAIAQLMATQQLTAMPIEGRRFDCGSRKGMLEATLAYALRDPELKPFVDEMIKVTV